MVRFKKLTAEEAFKFADWAHQNYKAGGPVDPSWHPVVRMTCEMINAEQHVECDKGFEHVVMIVYESGLLM